MIPNSAKALFIFICAALLLSTQSKKAPVTAVETIRFGNGGGFTGILTTYILSPDGKLTRSNDPTSGQDISLLKTIDKKLTKRFYAKANKIKDYTFNSPDNLYFFLEIQTKEKNNKIVWGFDKSKVDAKAISLYNELTALTK